MNQQNPTPASVTAANNPAPPAEEQAKAAADLKRKRQLAGQKGQEKLREKLVAQQTPGTAPANDGQVAGQSDGQTGQIAGQEVANPGLFASFVKSANDELDKLFS